MGEGELMGSEPWFRYSSRTAIRHKRFGRLKTPKQRETVTFGARTFSHEVRVKRDESQSETDVAVFGSLEGSVATGKTARKLGIFQPYEGHLIASH
jgi:hypothetical protein